MSVPLSVPRTLLAPGQRDCLQFQIVFFVLLPVLKPRCGLRISLWWWVVRLSHCGVFLFPVVLTVGHRDVSSWINDTLIDTVCMCSAGPPNRISSTWSWSSARDELWQVYKHLKRDESECSVSWDYFSILENSTCGWPWHISNVTLKKLLGIYPAVLHQCWSFVMCFCLWCFLVICSVNICLSSSLKRPSCSAATC